MKLSTNSVFLLVLVASSIVSARPLRAARGIASGRKQMSSAQGQSMGAAFFITNEPNGNFIVAADIGSDGKLNLREAVDTGGLGSHGISASITDPDPFFSQGAVKASAVGNIVAAVNAGSNTLSVFSIDPTNPTALKQIGRPVGSGGEFPVSLTINKAGNVVCALNGGAVNGVGCFSVDSQRGLVPIANTVRSLGLNQTTPATGPAGSVSHVVFSEDNTQLIASVKGLPPTPGFLAVWDVAADGSLSQDFNAVAPASGGLLPFGMAIIPGKNAILATDAGIGFDVFDFASVNSSSNSTTGGQSSSNAVGGQKAVCWAAFSKQTGNFYLSDIGTSIVTEVNVDDNLKPTVVKQYPQGNGVATIDLDVATVNNNDFLFVMASNATSIDVLVLNAPGKAQNIQTLDIAGPAKAAGLTISAANLQGMTTFIAE